MLSILLLIFGVFCCATSVLMIKASGLHPAVLSAYRLLGAALLLSPLYFAAAKKHRGKYSARDLRLTLLPALTLALHFISWAQGAQWTRAANATLLVNLSPVAVPFLLFLTMREKVTRPELVGTACALGGVAWLASSDFGLDRRFLLGDLTCFGSMLLFSYYLVQGRLNRDVPNLWLYLVPVYAFAGALCLLAALFVADPFGPHPARAYWAALGLAVIPTILGHSILNHAMQRLSGPVVGVCNLFQFLFAGALAFVLFGEAPRPAFYGAGALVVVGAVIVIRGVAATQKGEREQATTAAEGRAV